MLNEYNIKNANISKNNYLITDTALNVIRIEVAKINPKVTTAHLLENINLKVYYRADKLGKIDFLISSAPISKQDGWCDDPNSKYYNQFIKFPFAGSARSLRG